MNPPIAYAGTADRPFPPHGAGWTAVDGNDAAARRGASAIATTGALPLYSFVDDLVGGPGGGMYRFFAFDTPVGPRVGALRYTGTAGAPAWGDRAPSVLRTGQGPEASPPSSGAESLTAEQQAAVNMNNAIDAHGLVLVDQPIYEAFQAIEGLDPDGFPGPTTIRYLQAVLFQIGETLSGRALRDDGTPYPWVSMPGTIGYDGTNAPTWGAWTGASAPAVPPSPAPTPAPTPAPVPPTTSACSGWVADGSNADAVALASSIVFHSTPVAWADQTFYEKAINGTLWRVVMYTDNGQPAAATFRCSSPTSTPSSSSSGSGAGVALGVTAFLAALAAGGLVAYRTGVFR